VQIPKKSVHDLEPAATGKVAARGQSESNLQRRGTDPPLIAAV
jgi:hypothetical protein